MEGNEAPANPAPAPENPPAPAPAPAESNPAARAVIDGKSERELALEKELEDHKAGRRKAETDAAHAQDELRQLKDAQKNAPNPAQPAAKKASWGFFTED